MRILLLSILLLSFHLGLGQDSKTLADCFDKGDAKCLSQHFNTSIDLNIPENNGLYQKEQAIVLLEGFFKTLSIEKYEIKHEGGSKQKSRFHIGKLHTTKGSYRTYLLYNTVDSVMQIIELRIEEE